MKRYRKRKLKIINLKRFLTSITIMTLVMGTALIPIKDYIFKNVFSKNTASAKSNVNIEKNNDINVKNIDSEKKNNDALNVDKTNEEKNTDNNSVINDNVKVKTIDNKEFFRNAVFMGDSITEALSFYEFLDESKVIAFKGHTVVDAQENVDNIVNLSPESIFILFGMNDLETGINGEEFAKNYGKLIKMLKEKLPNSNIYIHSVLPISEEAQREDPLLATTRIDEFNRAIINMAKNENVNYINISPLLKENVDLYEPDGKHAKYHFYELWLDYIKNNIK